MKKQENVIKNKIDELIIKVLDHLESILNDKNSTPADKIAAASVILDISGLKRSKVDHTLKFVRDTND